MSAYCINRAARTAGGPVTSHRHAIVEHPVTPQKVGPCAIPMAHPTSWPTSSWHTAIPIRLDSGMDSYRFTAATTCTPLSSSMIWITESNINK